MAKEHLMRRAIKISILLFLGVFQFTFAQEEEEDLGTETVTVTKAYTPTISDAFKIKSVPNLNDSIVLQKKKIDYSIFSVPVASTFTPAKAKASRVKPMPPPVLFNSYASGGGGNPANVLAEFYTSHSIDRESGYTIGLNHNSSQANFDNLPLNSNFSNTRLDASFKKRDSDYDWGADIGVQHQLYNWYGTTEDFFSQPPFTDILANTDARQNYFMAEAGGHLNVEDSYFKGAKLQYRRFWDALKSGENRVVFEPSFEFPVGEENFEIVVKADYVNGNFANADLNNTENTSGIDYSHLQIGVKPSLTLLRDDLSLSLGVNLVYGLDSDSSNSEHNIYIYPAITASYRLLDELAIVYGGVEGELVQNSYYGFVEKNPFVSPTLNIQPTDNQYDSYLGLRGQLLPNLSYNVKGSYSAENRKPLFNLNPVHNTRFDEKGYTFGNSFQLFYDDLRTLGIFGELNVDVNRNFTLSVNGSYYNYTTETGNPAWNLPDVEASLFLDYQIGEKWFAGANLFYVGERKDFSQIAQPNVPASEFPTTIINLDSFFDANAHIGYRWTDQISFFLRASNIANNKYQRWANFPVQGLQILGGATFKFDL